MIISMETHAKANALIISLAIHTLLLFILLTRNYEQFHLSPEHTNPLADENNEIPIIFEEIPQHTAQKLSEPEHTEPIQQQENKPLKNMMADFFDGEPTPGAQAPQKHIPEKKIIQPTQHAQQEQQPEEKPVPQQMPEPLDLQDALVHDDEGTEMVVALPTNKKEMIQPPQKKQIEPASLQKKLTLADLVQGFLQQDQLSESDTDGNGGMHVLRVKAGKKGHASEKQLMHELYYKKILACIGNSFKIHRHKAPQTEQPHCAAIQMAIKRDGSIYSLQLLQSSGNRAIDDFALFLLKDASLSFPPVPKFFDTDIYTFIPFAFDNIFNFGYPEMWMVGPVER